MARGQTDKPEGKAGGGEDPRVRFATERTLLAWIRTGLVPQWVGSSRAAAPAKRRLSCRSRGTGGRGSGRPPNQSAVRYPILATNSIAAAMSFSA
jgi:hypothetical protein